MKKLNIEKYCIDVVTYDGKIIDTEWLLRNNLLKIDVKNDRLFILKDNDGNEKTLNEEDFEIYLMKHQ